ncbi:MAG: HU family DNA-binding protein [Prevotellaceae bacterium]|jgi:nucleoid DNA-binding protein/phosphoribosylanthranilate isomerase|nr:HU family DNA-binding protein [Prevotellaceae bacterium]
MNNEKISIQDLLDAIVHRTGYTKKKSDDFLHAFQSTIEEALIADGLVKVKGFGTFKLQWNEPRKSVNIHTGEEIIIPGHNKVAFTPEASVKAYINSSSAKHLIDPLAKLNEQAVEIKGLLNELQGVSAGQQTDSSITKEKEMPTAVQKEAYSTDETVVLSDSAEQTVTEKQNAENLDEVENNEILSEVQKRKIPVKKKRNKKLWIWILLFLIAVAAVFVFRNEISEQIRNMKAKVKMQIEQYHEKEAQKKANEAAEKVKNTDEIGENLSSVQKTEPQTVIKELAKKEEAKQVEKSVSIFDRPRSYTSFKATETLAAGSMLTDLAEKYYGNRIYWVYIYEANRSRISNPDRLPAGFTVKIPNLPPELIESSNPECLKYAKQLENKYKK